MSWAPKEAAHLAKWFRLRVKETAIGQKHGESTLRTAFTEGTQEMAVTLRQGKKSKRTWGQYMDEKVWWCCPELWGQDFESYQSVGRGGRATGQETRWRVRS